MQRRTKKLLEDARLACEEIRGLTLGKGLQDYLADRALRLSVERLFITLGEALSQLSKLDSEVAESIADLPRIVGFRNVLVHGYAVIEDDVVWQMAEARVPLCSKSWRVCWKSDRSASV